VYPLGQATPQAPQLFGSVAVSTQASPHGVSVEAHWHWLKAQVDPPVHWFRHPPQLSESELVSTQVPEQSCSPLGHSRQAPSWQPFSQLLLVVP
jgi:hypothetical protein